MSLLSRKRPLWLGFSVLTLGLLCLLLFPNIQPVQAASRFFSEDFTTTDNMDIWGYTNASGWGTGSISLPNKSLTLIGSYDTPNQASNIFVEGNYVFIADNMWSLQVANITDPANPTNATAYNTGSPGYIISDVFVAGDYAYVTSPSVGAGFFVFNITDLTDIQLIGSYNPAPGGNENQVLVSGDYAYVAAGSSGLYIVDISDPTTPSTAGFYDTPDNAYSLALAGNIAFVGDGSTVQVINVTNPATPTFLGSIVAPGWIPGLHVYGNYLYVATASDGLQILNITKPSVPTLAGSYDTPSTAYNVFVDGDYVYIADGGTGLIVLDNFDPTNPILLRTYDTPGAARDVEVVGNYAYIADSGSGLTIVEVYDSITPTQADVIDTPDSAYEVFIDGNYAYVTSWLGGLRIINITDPTNLNEVSYYDPGQLESVWVEGDFAYIGDSGLTVLNVTDPSDPTVVGSYSQGQVGNSIYVDGEVAYLTARDLGVYAINITDPTNPTYLDSLAFSASGVPHTAYSVYAAGEYAFVATEPALYVVNITDPTNLHNVSTFIPPFQTASHVVAEGNYAFVTDYGGGTQSSGLYVVDITDPLNPTQAGFITTSGLTAWGVDVDGDFAYVTDMDTGFHRFNISDPTNPTLIDTFDTSGYAMKVQVEGEYAFVADRGPGLQTVKLKMARSRQYNGLAIAASTGVNSAGSDTTVVSATLTVDDTLPAGTSIAYYMGVWHGSMEQVTPGVEHVFSGTGSVVYWRAVLSTTDPLVTPVIYQVNISSYSVLDAPWLIQPDNGYQTNDSTPFFEWGGYAGAANYLLQLDTMNTFDSVSLRNITVTGATDYTVVTPLADGTWYWRVACNDSEGDLGFFSNIRSMTIDTVGPVAPTLTTPANETLSSNQSPMLGWSIVSDAYRYIVQVDTVPTFDSGNLQTDIRSSNFYYPYPDLTEGTWYWRVACRDDFGNQGPYSEIFVYVVDLTPPTWDQTPTDQILEFGESCHYDLNASDAYGIDYYWLTGASEFAFDANGVLYNTTLVPVGDYYLLVRAFDNANHFVQADITITVEDTTPPIWLEVPDTELTIVSGDDLNYPLRAWDLSGISHIEAAGSGYFLTEVDGDDWYLRNVDVVPPGVYTIDLTVDDNHGNSLQASITITVEEPATTEPPPPPPPIPGFPIGAIALGIIAAISIEVIIRRKRRKP